MFLPKSLLVGMLLTAASAAGYYEATWRATVGVHMEAAAGGMSRLGLLETRVNGMEKEIVEARSETLMFMEWQARSRGNTELADVFRDRLKLLDGRKH